MRTGLTENPRGSTKRWIFSSTSLITDGPISFFENFIERRQEDTVQIFDLGDDELATSHQKCACFCAFDDP